MSHIQKSIWDEQELAEAGIDVRKRYIKRMWTKLFLTTDLLLEDIPFRKWNIPKATEATIRDDFVLFTTKVVLRQDSKRGDTTKLLIELQDGHQVETVIMRHRAHATVCISSQIGCKMGCKFCATGTMGIIGDLTEGEILEQLVRANRITRIRNVVFMGMGEPLNNYTNVRRALHFMTDPERCRLSRQHVTVSTVGVLKNMRRLTDDLPGLNLAVSLHAPNNTVRALIVPSAPSTGYEKLLEALDYHILRNDSDGKGGAGEGNEKAMAVLTEVCDGMLADMGDENENERKDERYRDKSEQVAGNDECACGQVGGCGSAVHDVEKRTEGGDAAVLTAAFAEAPAEEAVTKQSESDIESGSTSGGKARHRNADRGFGAPRKKSYAIMIEYILIHDINDRAEHARELVQVMRPRAQHILLNLIPYNPTDVFEAYMPPTPEAVKEFFDICVAGGMYTRVRQEMGQDIDGACGQLALVGSSAPVAEKLKEKLHKKKGKAASAGGWKAEDDTSHKEKDADKSKSSGQRGGTLASSSSSHRRKGGEQEVRGWSTSKKRGEGEGKEESSTSSSSSSSNSNSNSSSNRKDGGEQVGSSGSLSSPLESMSSSMVVAAAVATAALAVALLTKRIRIFRN
jgi:adenine C2-methylase RlmN of 23S rRNA A2503 and tRNA A37